MNDLTDSGQQPPSDQVDETTDAIASDLSGAADDVTNASDAIDQTIQNGLDAFEQKFDDFMSGLDRFLGKF